MGGMIEIVGLTRTLPEGQKLLDNIRAELEPGTLIAVAGASGSGKSVLLRCLALREPWSSGEYRVDGRDLLQAGLPARLRFRRKIAYLEQKPLLYEKKTALRNVLIGAVGQTPFWRRWTGMVRGDDYMGAMDMLERVGLIDRAHQAAEKLSGGERQRVAIARALVHGAKLLVADEPVSGLDPHAQDDIMSLLKQVCKEQGVNVVVALHRLELAEKYADVIWGLVEGRLELLVKSRRLTAAEKAKLV
jgi:phosphonate transport system ATP-binding protein